jgi:hypothetical protein
VQSLIFKFGIIQFFPKYVLVKNVIRKLENDSF